MQKGKIFLCAINNILSGICSEDCKFCAQSSKYKADIERYSFKSKNLVLQGAKKAYLNGATGYCLVTAGKELDDKRVDYLTSLTHLIKKELPNLRVIACCGLASKEALRELKYAGVSSYNHNLESSEKYYSKICSTHSWSERYKTCENVKSVGLKLCSGGIFGMGETKIDRLNLIDSLLSLKPDSIPINFYVPNPSLPIKKRDINQEEALKVIKKVRESVGNDKIVMVAGGREALFFGDEVKMFEAGANSIVIGNYLTVKGAEPNKDVQMVQNLGYQIAKVCNE
jgi:biotin synthase